MGYNDHQSHEIEGHLANLTRLISLNVSAGLNARVVHDNTRHKPDEPSYQEQRHRETGQDRLG